MNSQQELVVKQCWPKKENEQSNNIVQRQHQLFLTSILTVLIKVVLYKRLKSYAKFFKKGGVHTVSK